MNFYGFNLTVEQYKNSVEEMFLEVKVHFLVSGKVWDNVKGNFADGNILFMDLLLMLSSLLLHFNFAGCHY